MRSTILLFALLASLTVMNAQNTSFGITFGGALNIDERLTDPSDFYFYPNMQIGATGKTIFFDRLTVEASLLYGIRQLNFHVPKFNDDKLPYDDQCYSSSLSISPVVGFRCFEIGKHNLNIGIGAEPTYFIPHSASLDGIGKYKNSFDVPLLAKLTYGISGIDLAVTYKHSFLKQYDAPFNNSKIRELMFSIYLPISKK